MGQMSHWCCGARSAPLTIALSVATFAGCVRVGVPPSASRHGIYALEINDSQDVAAIRRSGHIVARFAGDCWHVLIPTADISKQSSCDVTGDGVSDLVLFDHDNSARGAGTCLVVSLTDIPEIVAALRVPTQPTLCDVDADSVVELVFADDAFEFVCGLSRGESPHPTVVLKYSAGRFDPHFPAMAHENEGHGKLDKWNPEASGSDVNAQLLTRAVLHIYSGNVKAADVILETALPPAEIGRYHSLIRKCLRNSVVGDDVIRENLFRLYATNERHWLAGR